MKCKKLFFIVNITIGLPLALQAQQVVNPEGNIPVTPAPATPSSNYPDLYNHAFGANKLNYIRTWIPDQPLTEKDNNLKHRQQTRYFDGLGRPLQEVQKKAHADGNDIITHHIYDASGRESMQYLPFARSATSSQGNYDNLPRQRIESFYPYSQGEIPYGVTEFEPSPLGRPKKIMAPGRSWVGSSRAVLMDYNPNTNPKHVIPGANPVHHVVKGAYPRFKYITGNQTVVYDGHYGEGDLFVTKIRDEDDHLKEEIKDKSGKLIMTRILAKETLLPQLPAGASPEMIPANYVYTIYVYDELGRLCFVLPPQNLIGTPVTSTEVGLINLQGNTLTQHIYTYSWSAPTTEQMNELCYQYKYDQRGRLIEKQIPGKAVEYFVYDNRDRLVLSQDGNLRQSGKWAFSFYDALDRTTITGLLSLADTRSSLQYQATEPASSIPANSWRNYVINYFNPSATFGHYPPALIGAEILTYSYYDNYDLVSGNFDATKIPAVPTGDASVLPSSYSTVTKGMLTGTRVRVLDPANPNSSQWITTAYYYDSKGRMIQSTADNHKGGMDYSSQLYYFQGMPYRSVSYHHNPVAQPIPGANAALNHIKLDKTYRRNLGQGGNEQVWQLQQTINDGTPYNLAYYDYDHMGRIVLKQYTMANVLQEYNIRGWLKQIHARNPMHQDSTYFRENLYYDDGFESKLYNGNIAGITWNNYGVIDVNDTKRNAYGYSYDKLGRLTHAEFRNNPSLPGSWVKNNKDYTASNITYDDRGNILSMAQRGNNLSGPIQMDDLMYEYAPNTNKLLKVQDNVSAANTMQLPDFKNEYNVQTAYDYDENGNLISDPYKRITSITYNHLNMPAVITISDQGIITYVYDAIGNKLQKRIHNVEAQTTETWDYMGNFVYKDNVLQYILNEEGRSRSEVVSGGSQSGATKFVYDYFIKDHLGNVRTTLAAEPSDHEYYARHEIATANSENLFFENIAAVRDDKPGSINLDDLKAARLNGSETDRRIGTAIMLRVMPGDKFTFATDAYYEGDDGEKDYNYTGAEEVVSSLLATLVGGTVGGNPVKESGSEQLIRETFARPEMLSGLENLLNEVDNNYTGPKAGLNYLFFDANMNLLSKSGRLSIREVNPNIFNNLSYTTEPATETGYVIVYVDNQTMGKDVWFDNVQVLHYNTQVLEENHYYPFGLTLSETGNMNTSQPYKLTSKELEQSFGINNYDFGARHYDMQLGRWMNIDPLAEKYFDLSSYSFCGNNPINYVDLDGREFTERSKPHLDQYRGEVQKRIDNNNAEIASIREKISSNKIKESKGNKQIAKAESRNLEMQKIQAELNSLESSTQVYDIIRDSKSNSTVGAGTKEVYSGFSFNLETGVAEIYVGDGSLGMISHELKHAFQFEIGKLSGGNRIPGSPHPFLLYDKTDEVEAYARGNLFGGQFYNIWNLPDIYMNLPNEPMDINSIPFFINNGNSPTSLQTFSRSSKVAFRIKGVTYYPNKKQTNESSN